jgi:hypothetical protein
LGCSSKKNKMLLPKEEVEEIAEVETRAPVGTPGWLLL